MPRSIFLGRPWPQPGEPLWTDEDRAWALALLELEADECPGCGQPRSETTLIEHQDAYRAEPVRCHACAAAERAVRKMAKDERADMAGITARFTKLPGR